MYEIVTLAEIKQWCNITDDESNAFLESMRDAVTKIIENYTSKIFITRQFTEYYDGEKLHKLCLKQYPIYVIYDISKSPIESNNITVHDDSDRKWESTSLIDASDLIVYADIGQISLYDDEYKFADATQNVKVIYYAGYSRFNVVDEHNNYLDVTDGGGTAAVEISPAENRDTNYPGYNAEDLATAIQTALNANATLNGTYTVTYSQLTQLFTIACDEDFAIPHATGGASDSKKLSALIGFTVNDAGAASYISDEAVTGLPDDIILAAKQIIDQLYDMSKVGKGEMLTKSISLPQGMGTMSLMIDKLPLWAQEILNSYQRRYL